jgi:hypothetical protein
MADTTPDPQPSSNPNTRHRAIFFTIIFLVAFGVRGCAVLSQPETPIADAADYHQIAASLADGRGYVNAAGKRPRGGLQVIPPFCRSFIALVGPACSRQRSFKRLPARLRS